MSRLEDEAALRRTAETYAAGADRRDKALWTQVMTEDIVIEGPGFRVEGREAALGSIDMLERMFLKTQHRVHNQIVTIAGDRRAHVGDFVLETDEYEHRSSSAEGWAVAEDHEWVVAVTTELDDELVLEGLAREVVRLLQVARKDAGLEVSDRIAVQWHADGRLGEAIAGHGGTIADEVLATSFERAEAAPGGATTSTVDGEDVALAITRA